MTLLIFLVMVLHFVILGCFQWQGTFIFEKLENHLILNKTLFYFVGILISCFHQPIARRFGLRNSLVAGMFSNALGLILFIAYSLQPLYALLALSMIFMGFALLSVLNSLVAYVILVFSKRTIVGIATLYAFSNFGMMLSPHVLHYADALNQTTELLYLLVALVLMCAVGTLVLFEEPQAPKDAERFPNRHLWSEMPVRLGLYLLCMGLYSMVENTFGLWGGVELTEYFRVDFVQKAISLFWLCMIFGQLSLFFLLRYLKPKYILCSFGAIVLASILLILNTSHFQLVYPGVLMGGFGCSAFFPLILFSLEEEIRGISMKESSLFLPLLESGISYITASFMFCTALNDLWKDLFATRSHSHFWLSALYLLLCIGIYLYLNSSKKERSFVYTETT